MFKIAVMTCAVALLAGCGDPLADFDRLSDVDLREINPAAAALATEEEIAREGFFGTPAALGRTAASGATAEPEASTTERGGGLAGVFGRTSTRNEGSRNGPDARDVPFGTVLANGIVARVCDAKGKSLGRRIEKAPARDFALYDSTPGSAGPRTWYLTGFSDGCPRQLTAATVLLGSAPFYEQLHYGTPGAHLTYAATDKAYESIKRRICGSGRGKPCGAKIGRMEKSTFFVSAYDSFGNSSRWTEVLIHDGKVLALAVKTNG